MPRILAHRQNRAGNLRMHGFNAAVEHFREPGHLADIADGDTGIAQQPGRAAGGNQFRAERRQSAREFGHTTLIGDAEEYTHIGNSPA